MLVDVLQGLHVPTISAPPASIPRWNEFGENWLVPIFDFASAYLHDHGAVLLMYPSSSSHRGQLLGCYAEYGFKVSQSWLGMNRLHLTSSSNPSLTVIFRTFMFRRAYTGATIYACRAVRRHILALEADEDIFAALLAPMMRNTAAPEPKSQVSNLDIVDLEEEQVPVQRIVKTTRFSK